MKIELAPGVYVVAVSGGVDSMALLHMLAKSPELRVRSSKTKNSSSSQLSAHGYKLIVAHFDHGIRPDSEEDRKLVQQTATAYGLPFVFDNGNLGNNASEASARQARYKFLSRVLSIVDGHSIVTAHHQDDVIETAIINMIRGTGRKGISSLSSRKNITRPLLDISKADLHSYAKKHNIVWREDSTNNDTAYLRNYVRHNLVPKLTKQQKKELLGELRRAKQINPKIDELLASFVKKNMSKKGLDRQQFIALNHTLSLEIMASWLRLNHLAFDKKLLDRLVIASKTLAGGKQVDINAKSQLHIGKKQLSIREKKK